MAEKDATARLRRAVQENNLFLVKRLVQRTDMRNPDPAPRRFTSLAWAAVLGHEETFEFLLTAGHDDEELSKDSENNTILTLLADLKPPAPTSYSPSNPDFMAAALRMARLYYDRYPFVLDWANANGRTALHVASLRGNEELVRMLLDLGADFDLADNEGNTPLHYASAWGHIPIVQLLIERGCQYAARNNEGFTASDYAYSFSTKDTLQDTARMQFENNKKSRRQVFAQAAARGNEWGGTATPNIPSSLLLKSREANGSSRMRSGSGGSRTTATSDSGDMEGGTVPPWHQINSQSSVSSTSSPSQLSANSSGSFFHVPPVNNTTNPSLSSSSSTFSPGSSALPTQSSPRNPHVLNPASALSPIANRVREQDADAIAKYRQTRNRSGSADTGSIDVKSSYSSRATHTNGLPPLPMFGSNAQRRLRPSASAAQLRSTPPPPLPTVTTNQETPRSRAGTTPTPTRPPPSSITPPAEPPTPPPRPSFSREGSSRGPSKNGQDYTGPPSDYAKFPPPPEIDGPSANQTTPTVVRRLPFNLRSKPLPSIDPQVVAGGHHRGSSATSIRS